MPTSFDVSGAAGIECRVDAQDNQPHAYRVYHVNSSENLTMTIPLPVQEALRDSITSGTFVNTKFWVFSKRSSKPGRVGEPKALLVNEHVAKRIPRLASRAPTLIV